MNPLSIFSSLTTWAYRPRPQVKLECFCNGSSGADGVGITVQCWNEGRGHALRTSLRAYLDADLVREIDADVPAGAIDHRVRFALDRPAQAELVHTCDSEPTFWGKALNVELVWHRRVIARAALLETERVAQWRQSQAARP